jgi:hypothetical protein
MARLTTAERNLLRRIGRKGGKARAKNLSAAKLSAIARKAAEKRWGKGSSAE